MRLLLLMLFACGEKEATTNTVSTTTQVVETQTLETTDEKNTNT